MPIRTFLDANVLITAFKGEGAAASKALDIIANAERDFVISDVLRLEVIPKATFEGQVEEREFYERFFALALEDVPITKERTVGAIDMANQYGLNAVDALHIEVARSADVLEFLTFEKPTKPFFRVDEGDMVVLSLYAEPEADPA